MKLLAEAMAAGALRAVGANVKLAANWAPYLNTHAVTLLEGKLADPKPGALAQKNLDA